MGQGRVIRGDAERALVMRNVAREEMADHGISFIRRASGAGRDYFLANLTAEAFDGWVTLGGSVSGPMIEDPLTGRSGIAAHRSVEGGATQVYLQLAPGESLLLRSGTAPSMPPSHNRRQFVRAPVLTLDAQPSSHQRIYSLDPSNGRSCELC